MKRYYLCPIIGDGTRANPYRPKLSNYGISFASVFPLTPSGSPAHTWTLCVVTAPNHLPLLTDPDLDALPDVSLDVKWTAVATAIRQRVEARLAARGVMLLSDGQTGYRDIVRQIGRALDSSFDENNFAV